MKQVLILTACFITFTGLAHAQEMEFRGWKRGDWILLRINADMLNEPAELMAKNRDVPPSSSIYIYSARWCKLEDIGAEHLLITTFYRRSFTMEELKAGISFEKKEIVKVREPSKSNIEKRSIEEVVEWKRGDSPPRPWWGFF